MVLLKSLLTALLDGKMIENRRRISDKSGKSYCIVDSENADPSSASKTESKMNSVLL